ncbi:hypothetical protein AJ79_07097 [Helicocarpus griseus UAMH5409]|uniref:Peptide N-acetyl-beta-D-glucosaminyl asparaginase amidase A N-terminal domain-containing protein n=1 Tax=Helicocarpus griseus UAMH5409 TaxID=1447875 RepID=A0A2B7X6E7_9EURO|nr:hypothetical protein AJ79_07097 [Helicocarpus griseus UAMH5409]
MAGEKPKAPIEKRVGHHTPEKSRSLQTPNRKDLDASRFHTSMLCVFAILLTFLCYCAVSPRAPSRALKTRIVKPNGSLLQVFQVYKPVTGGPTEGDPDGCNTELLLMKHEFGFSYGHPFAGNYVPPQCNFDTVIMNITVTSKGRQFDRLALMFLGDTEVFRTSTAEPTRNGIIWSYVKDMSIYKSLWAESQKLIFDLGNLIDDTYTGWFNVTVTARFSLVHHKITTADVILPISAQRSAVNSSSWFNLPDDNATISHLIPDRASRAVVSISACGQSTEEFWYNNVLTSDIYTFNETTGPLYGYSSFREIQLYIDGQLAGVVWPFPIIFTGGIAPGFWRPIVGIDAFDLREPEIDITPFLPFIADGDKHSFRLSVVGLGDVENGSAEISEQVGSYWVVTAKIFVYLDEFAANSTISQGKDSNPVVSTQFSTEISNSWRANPDTAVNETLLNSAKVSRTLSVISPFSKWTQSLSFSNLGHFTEQGAAQFTWQNIASTSESVALVDGKDIIVSRTASNYPLEMYSGYTSSSGGLNIKAKLSRGLQFTHQSERRYYSTYTLTAGPSEFDAMQFGGATYGSTKNGSWSTGDTTETFEEISGGNTLDVRVRAVNGTVIEGDKVPSKIGEFTVQDEPLARGSVREILGRGPGRSKP